MQTDSALQHVFSLQIPTEYSQQARAQPHYSAHASLRTHPRTIASAAITSCSCLRRAGFGARLLCSSSISRRRSLDALRQGRSGAPEVGVRPLRLAGVCSPGLGAVEQPRHKPASPTC